MYLVHPLGDGKFEIIDSDFLHLYSQIEPQNLVELSSHQYQQYLKKQNILTTFEDGVFVFRDIESDSEQIKRQQQHEMWDGIKQKRHTITRGGVYVPSVKKWFHTDDSSRTQYLALQILPQLPSDLMWKTMDNSFVKLTKSLLTELAMTILQSEQADFANAERHRVAMLKADNPLEYDYSTGWSEIYE